MVTFKTEAVPPDAMESGEKPLFISAGKVKLGADAVSRREKQRNNQYPRKPR